METQLTRTRVLSHRSRMGRREFSPVNSSEIAVPIGAEAVPKEDTPQARRFLQLISIVRTVGTVDGILESSIVLRRVLSRPCLLQKQAARISWNSLRKLSLRYPYRKGFEQAELMPHM